MDVFPRYGAPALLSPATGSYIYQLTSVILFENFYSAPFAQARRGMERGGQLRNR